MEPRVSYVRTSDGVDVACAVSGSGPVLISVPSPPDNHVQLELDQPGNRESVEAISQHRTLVRFDGRGTGLSERSVKDFSLQARLRDLEAVADFAGGNQFALISGAQGNQLAVAYAAQHPERVTHVVAVNPFVRGTEFLPRSQMVPLDMMLTQNFEMFTENVGAMTFGWGNEEGPRYGAYFRQCVTPGTALALYRAMSFVNLAPYLPKVNCPVLVLRYKDAGVGSDESTRRFVAGLPNATFSILNGFLAQSTSIEMRKLIGDFLGDDWSEPEPQSPFAVSRASRGELRMLLFTDVEDHARIMEALGDARGREVLREHERITREALGAHGGHEVKTMGDGFFASFLSAQGALECAIDLQRRFEAANEHLPAPLRVRIGVNAGEPIMEDDDLFGASVITTARIAALCSGGKVLAADVVRQLVAGKGFLFSDTGEHVLKGMEDPVRVWELRWQAD